MIAIKRKIGTIALDVTLEEDHNDELAITQFPVLSGAVITDHSYKKPMRVTIKGGKGTSKKLDTDTIYNPTDVPGDESLPRKIYNQLLNLQKSREPFTIVTGKRVYNNMLIRSLKVVTNTDTENSLVVTADCQEVIIVSTKSYNFSGEYKDQQLVPTEDGKGSTTEEKSSSWLNDVLGSSFNGLWKLFTGGK